MPIFALSSQIHKIYSTIVHNKLTICSMDHTHIDMLNLWNYWRFCVAAQFAGGESGIPGGATGNFGSEGRQQVTAPYDDRSGAVGGGNAAEFQQVIFWMDFVQIYFMIWNDDNKWCHASHHDLFWFFSFDLMIGYVGSWDWQPEQQLPRGWSAWRRVLIIVVRLKAIDVIVKHSECFFICHVSHVGKILNSCHRESCSIAIVNVL